MDNENPTKNAKTKRGNLIFRNISESNASFIEIEIVPMKGVIKIVNIEIVNKIIIWILLFINFIFLNLSKTSG